MALLNKTILLLFIFLISLQTLSHSQEVRIGTYIINAGKFDPQSGSYTVDFYLSMQCEVNCSQILNLQMADLQLLIKSLIYRITNL